MLGVQDAGNLTRDRCVTTRFRVVKSGAVNPRLLELHYWRDLDITTIAAIGYKQDSRRFTTVMSLFDQPAWAKTPADDEDDPTTDIFSHGSRSYAEIVAEESRKKKVRDEKLKSKKDEKERKASAKREIEVEETRSERKERRTSSKRESSVGQSRKGSSSPKKRRITLEEGDDLLGSIGLSPGLKKRWTGFEVESNEDLPPMRSPRANKVKGKDDSQFAKKPAKPEVIELGGTSGSDDEVQFSHAKPAKPKPAEPIEAADSESDDEIAQLRRQARARKKSREESLKKSQTPTLNSPTTGPDASDESRPAYPTPPAPDPPVKLFITSDIPGTKPLMVYRKLSQSLKVIRVIWCEKQGFDKSFADKVYLTHRMRRVFDVTTCRSLGLSADADGNITMRGHEGAEDVDQVHLEAVTDELYAQIKAAKEREERVRHGLQTPEEEDAAQAGAEEPPPKPQEQLIRILLTSKDKREPFKLRVKSVWKSEFLCSVKY